MFFLKNILQCFSCNYRAKIVYACGLVIGCGYMMGCGYRPEDNYV